MVQNADQDGANTLHNIPGYQRTTSSIYNLIHSSNNSNVPELEGGEAPAQGNNQQQQQQPHEQLQQQQQHPEGTPGTAKGFNLIPQGQNFNTYYMGDNNNRPILPSLPSQGTSPNTGRSMSQHSVTSIPNPIAYERTRSVDPTPTSAASLDPAYYQQANLSRAQSNISAVGSDAPKTNRVYHYQNQMIANGATPVNFSSRVNSNSSNGNVKEFVKVHPGGNNLGAPMGAPATDASHQFAYIEPNTNKTAEGRQMVPKGSMTHILPIDGQGNASSRSNSTLSTSSSKSKHNNLNNTNNSILASRRNTQELVAKSIAEKHLDKPISEYASIVRDAEVEVLNINPVIHSKATIQALEQKKERDRQVYALLWLMKNCEAQHDSYVPRGRIFAQYASSCALYNLKPLSQASLGKLIRTVFPGLTTRRLGMRGQSKYHYCGLKLINADSSDEDDEDHDSVSNIESPPAKSASTGPMKIKEEENAASFKTDDNKEQPSSTLKRKHTETTEDGSSPDHDVKKQKSENQEKDANETSPSDTSEDNSSVSLHNVLEVVFKNPEILSETFRLPLPPLPKSKIPGSVDQDIVSSLESLYHIYCNKIFENIKFLNFDSLPNNLRFFHTGSVSPQMYNLLISEELYDWVAECDDITYVSVAIFLSSFVIDRKRTSEENTKNVQKLEKFIEEYPKLMTDLTMELPVPLRTSKNNLARQFTFLIKRLLKLEKFIIRFIDSFQSYKAGMKSDWESINLSDIYEVVCTGKHDDACKAVIDFLNENIPLLFREEKGIDDPPNNESFNLLMIKFLQFVSDAPWSANTILNSYTRITNALIGDISLKSSENLLLWLFFNNVTDQFLTYSYDAMKFSLILNHS
ncbi:Rfx1 protein [Maudiozyma humilis]|uniref:Rfx1 protein n=1 Tax=Maudiozyma humilis TaxID=51915 RepID=A0AAV5RZQ0_MAUHU|nr:Rfx1 protein [Kazachstania humilis]